MLNALAADIHPQARLHEPLVVIRFLGQRIGRRGCLGRRLLWQLQFGLDGLPELVVNPLAERLQAVQINHALFVHHFQQPAAKTGVFGRANNAAGRDLLQRPPLRFVQRHCGQAPVDPQAAIVTRVVLHRRHRQPGGADVLFQPLQLMR